MWNMPTILSEIVDFLDQLGVQKVHFLAKLHRASWGGARSDGPRAGCELDNVLVAHASPASGHRVVLCRLAVLAGSCHTADSAWFE